MSETEKGIINLWFHQGKVLDNVLHGRFDLRTCRRTHGPAVVKSLESVAKQIRGEPNTLLVFRSDFGTLCHPLCRMRPVYNCGSIIFRASDLEDGKTYGLPLDEKPHQANDIFDIPPQRGK